MKCQSTFQEHCTFPRCDCDRPEPLHEYDRYCLCPSCRIKKYKKEKVHVFSEKEDWRDSNWGDD